MKKLCLLLLASLLVFNLFAKTYSLEEASSQLLPHNELYIADRKMELTPGLGVYIYDPKDTTANVRNAPNGKVVAQLYNEVTIEIDSIKGKWCRIARNRYTDDEDTKKIVETDCELWIHVSCIGCDFIGGGNRNLTLYSKPTEDSTPINIETEVDGDIDCLLDIKGNWVKVRLSGGKSGWISSYYICGNPNTICS